MNLDPPLEPPAELTDRCVECGAAIDGDGWCDTCAAWERRDANRDY